jgi:hypothetical protein
MLMSKSQMTAIAETLRQVHPGEFAKRMTSIKNGEGLDSGGRRLLAQNLVDETLLGLGYGEGLAILEWIRKQV